MHKTFLLREVLYLSYRDLRLKPDMPPFTNATIPAIATNPISQETLQKSIKQLTPPPLFHRKNSRLKLKNRK